MADGHDATYGLIQKFHVDDGELDGLAPQLIFVLGVEFGSFQSELQRNSEPFRESVHVENSKRIQHMCWVSRRSVEEVPTVDGWVVLNVGARRR